MWLNTGIVYLHLQPKEQLFLPLFAMFKRYFYTCYSKFVKINICSEAKLYFNFDKISNFRKFEISCTLRNGQIFFLPKRKYKWLRNMTERDWARMGEREREKARQGDGKREKEREKETETHTNRIEIKLYPRE